MSYGTRDSIRQFGEGSSWIYDDWAGVLPIAVEPWFTAEMSNDDRSVFGRHCATPEEAVADAKLLIDEAAARGKERYTDAIVVRHSPALRISIERELDITDGEVRDKAVDEQGRNQTTQQIETELREALADVGEIIESLPHDRRHDAVNEVFDTLLPNMETARDFFLGVVLHAHEFRLFKEAVLVHGRQDVHSALAQRPPGPPANDVGKEAATGLTDTCDGPPCDGGNKQRTAPEQHELPRDYAAARPPLSERPGDHTWAFTGERGRCRDYRCTDFGCIATHVEVSAVGGLDCPFHGQQLSAPCYSCQSTPWRYGSDWGRCTFVDVNALGDSLRCALYAGHNIHHEMLCAADSPEGHDHCWLEYAHPGDNHVNRDGTVAWVDAIIGPPSRKTLQQWETTTNA